MTMTRRNFVAASAAAVLTHRSGTVPSVLAPEPAATRTILFQGDSITDAGRDRKHGDANNPAGLGDGYPLLIAAALRDRYAQRGLQIYNRGVSGNTVPDLQERWEKDTLAFRPELLSILIGVNDIWHTRAGSYHGTVATYEQGYRELLDTTRRALPNVRLVIMEPFVMRTGAVSDDWFPEFDEYRAAAKRVAQGAHATWVPLHEMLMIAAKATGPAYWLADGVHPTLAGHQAIARRWLERVKV